MTETNRRPNGSVPIKIVALRNQPNGSSLVFPLTATGETAARAFVAESLLESLDFDPPLYSCVVIRSGVY